MSLAATATATGLTNMHNGNNSNNNSGNLHVGIQYRNAPTHSSCPLKYQAPQSLYHCKTIYNQPLQASWVSAEDDDEDDDEDEVTTESGSETPPIKDNAATVVGRYEALLDDEAITKSYLDPTCISPPPITTLEKTKSSKLSQIRSRIQSTPVPVSATTTTTMRHKDNEGINKDTLLTRTVENDTAIASRPSLSPLPVPPPTTTPRSPVPMGGSSSSSFHSRSSLAQRNMVMRSGSLPSLSYNHYQQQQQPISSMLSSTSTCSSSSVSSDPLFSAGTGSSSNSSNGETNDSCSPVPSSSTSRLKLAFQKLRGRRSSTTTNNNEPMGPSFSDKNTSRKSTCSTITTKSSPTGPAPTKSTSLAKRIRSKFNKSKKATTATTTATSTTTNRVSRTTSLTSVATWSYPEQQQQQQQHQIHSSDKGNTVQQRLVSNQDRSLRHNRHRTQHWQHNHHHHNHHHRHHHHRHNPQQQYPHQRMMQPMPSMSSPSPSKGAIPRATSDMLLSSCSQQQQSSPMPLAASDTSVVRFARVVSVKETFSRYEYDRGSDPDAVCTRLTPAMAQYIKQELNMYKLNEMPVHEQSRMHTHFFL